MNKKEHKNGGCSPDSPGEDVDAPDYTLTPRTEAKYNKIDEEFQMMMQRTPHLNGAQRVTPISIPIHHHLPSHLKLSAPISDASKLTVLEGSF